MVPTFGDFYRELLRETTVNTYMGAVLLIIAPMLCTCGHGMLGAMLCVASGYLFSLEKSIVPPRRRIINAECKG